MSRRAAMVVLCVASLSLSAPSARADAGPTITGITWHARTGPPSDPVLSLTLGFDAPDGISGGAVKLASVHHEILHTVPLDPAGPGSHEVRIEFSAPGDKARPWEVIGVTLEGADGRTTTYGFCDLAPGIETREYGGRPRLGLVCLDGAGWVMFTVRAGEDVSATLWTKGVATRDHTYAGAGHVMQDAAGTVVRWGTSVTVAYPQDRDGTQISAGGQTIVNEPSPDPSSQPGNRRIVIGVGGSTPTNPALTPGAVYRWAAYYAIKPGHFDPPYVELEGEGLEVLDVQKGSSAGIAWGQEFDHSVVVQRSAAGVAAAAGGSVTRSVSSTMTCMFLFHGGGIGDFLGASVGRIEGPSAPPYGGVVVAGKPGEYRFNAHAGLGQAWGQFVAAYADLPLTPPAT